MSYKNNGYNNGRQPNKREERNANIWLIEGYLLKRCLCRQNRNNHDIYEQCKAYEIPKQQNSVIQFFSYKYQVINDWCCDAGNDIVIIPFKCHCQRDKFYCI